MSPSEVQRVIDSLAPARCVCWVGGGWGVDALLARETRPHRDLDLAFDAEQEAAALSVLERLGYKLKTDWRPVRFEVAAPAGRFVDMHPVVLDADGNGIQAGFDGETFVYPAASFTSGFIDGRRVNCLSAALQLEFHSGYEPRDIDRADIDLLQQVVARDGQD